MRAEARDDSMTSVAADICTLVWPLSGEPEVDADLPATEPGLWIVGWNPRGLSVVVAWFIASMPFADAKARLQRAKSALATHPAVRGLPRYADLQILGYVRTTSPTLATTSAATTGSNGAPLMSAVVGSPLLGPSVLRESSVRYIRQNNDIWLELQRGPVLGEVWCCGCRVQPCQLHVIRCDYRQHFSVKPRVFSATALYGGAAAVRALMSGQHPICLPGARSSLEGVLLPDIMRTESAPPQPRRLSGVAARRPRQEAAAMSSSVARGRDTSPTVAVASQPPANLSLRENVSSGNYTNNNGASTTQTFAVNNNSRSFAEANGSVSLRSLSLDIGVDSQHTHSFIRPDIVLDSEASATPERADHGATSTVAPDELANGAADEDESTTPVVGLPPRLDFPLSVDEAEMSITLAMCRAGRVVRHVLQRQQQRDDKKVKLDGITETNGEDGAMASDEADLSSSSFSSRSSASLPCLWRADVAVNEENETRVMRCFLWLLRLSVRWIATMAHFMAMLSPFSYTAGVMELRLRELANFLAILLGQTHRCGLHPVLPHVVPPATAARMVCLGNYVTRVLLDCALGLVISLLLSTGGPPLHAWAQGLARHFLYKTHQSYMHWFEGYPAGLKMNEDLNRTLCFLAQLTLTTWDGLMRRSPGLWWSGFMRVVRTTQASQAAVTPRGGSEVTASPSTQVDDPSIYYYWWILWSFYILVVLSISGCSCALAFVADLTGLVSLHLCLLYRATATLYRVTSTVLSNLYRQFRGQRYNPLRRRIDAYDFHLDQMLIATCLFTISVFLFPTIAVYFLYFAVIRVTVRWMQEALITAGMGVMYVPLFPLLYWLRYRRQLFGGVVLSGPTVTGARQVSGAVGVGGSGGAGGVMASNGGAGSTGNGGVAGSGEVHEDMSHTVEVNICSLPLPLHYMMADFSIVLRVLGDLLRPRQYLSLLTLGTLEPPPNLLQELIPHLLADCVDPPCTLCQDEVTRPKTE